LDTQIITDFIPLSYQTEVKNELLNNRFPWFYNPSIVDNTKQYDLNKPDLGSLKNGRDDIQMGHVFFNKEFPAYASSYFNLIRPLLYFLELKTGIVPKDLIRIKGNLLFRTNGDIGGCHIPHADQDSTSCISMVYYVIDSDGDTITYNERHNGIKQDTFTVETTSTPKQGNAIIFDSNRFHCSSLPIAHDARCIVNFIFKI